MALSHEERLHEAQRSVKTWKSVAAVGCTLALVSIIILVQQKALPKAQHSPSSAARPQLTIWFSPCPKVPRTVPLPPGPLPQPISDQLTKLEALLDSLVDPQTSLPAVSANVVYRGVQLWSGHRGSKRLATPAQPPDGDTRYRIGSVTKVFVVLMVYKLHEEKRIGSLDDPLNKYAPDFQIHDPYGHAAPTIRQMVSQMSGLPREAPCQFSCNATTTAEQLKKLRESSLVLPPWTEPCYSNLAFTLLARLLSERLLGRPFETWVSEEILGPLGMDNTGFFITEHVLQNMALPYTRGGRRGGKELPFKELHWSNPAGNMYSTLNDLTKLSKLFANPGKQSLFKPETLREMLRPMDIAPDGRTLWGSPWEMMLIDRYLVRGKAGNLDSYNTFVSYIPELELAVNVMVSTVEFAQQGGGLAAVVTTETALNTLLPSLTTTLLALEEEHGLPVNATPYLGTFRMEGKHPLFQTEYNVLVEVAVQGMGLVIKNYFRPQIFYKVDYIGDALDFRAKDTALPETCFLQRSGIYMNLRFFPLNREGLCPGFVIPDGNIIATRGGADAGVGQCPALWTPPDQWVK